MPKQPWIILLESGEEVKREERKLDVQDCRSWSSKGRRVMKQRWTEWEVVTQKEWGVRNLQEVGREGRERVAEGEGPWRHQFKTRKYQHALMLSCSEAEL